MSKFLEEVLAKPPQALVKPKEGLAGSPRRYAILLTLMAGLTAGPTWLMVRAGTGELDVAAVSPARPIVMGVPGAPPPANTLPPLAQGRAEWLPPAPPPEQPVAPQSNPILERTSVVDTSTRPMHKSKPRTKVKSKSTKDTPGVVTPVEQPAPQKPKAEPVQQQNQTQPGTPKRKSKKRQHHVERPQRPQIEAPLRIERDRS